VNTIVGVTGSGMIGRDPFDGECWSGSGTRFFTACREKGLLHRAFGVEAPNYLRLPLIALNHSFDRALWTQKFYLDTRYYRVLTHQIQKRLTPADWEHPILQLGAIYDVPAIAAGKTSCFSYHDGNLAERVKSPYWPQGIPAGTIDKAREYERRVYEGMDVIFTMSEYLKASFVENFDVDERKVVCIGAGVNLQGIPAVEEKDYTGNMLLFVGVDFRRKGGATLLEAFRIVHERHPDSSLHIVGPRVLSIPDKDAPGVVFHGFLDKKVPGDMHTLQTLWRDACLFVLPSEYEPFGIAALEAQMYGIPCILTNRWAFPEMVQEGVTGELVPCGRAEPLAETILTLLDDPDRLGRMGRAARKNVVENYTWNAVVDRLREHMAAVR